MRIILQCWVCNNCVPYTIFACILNQRLIINVLWWVQTIKHVSKKIQNVWQTNFKLFDKQIWKCLTNNVLSFGHGVQYLVNVFFKAGLCQTLEKFSSKLWNFLCKKCLTVWPRHKTLLDMQDFLINGFEKLQNFMPVWSKHIWRAMFCDVAKRANIVLEGQISNVWLYLTVWPGPKAQFKWKVLKLKLNTSSWIP